MAEASEEGQGPRRAVETMMMMMITAHEYPTIRRGHVPLKKNWPYIERSYHEIRFSVDLHVMNEDTFQIK
jgi:hypothetical protein